MTDTPTGRSREELLERSRERHTQLEAQLVQLIDADLTRPGVTDGWSVKDHLAHLTWWEQRVILVLGGAPDPIDAIPGAEKTEDSVNAYFFAANQGRPLAEVRAAFDASYQQMLHLIQTVPDDVLAQRYGWISGNAADHYDEHLRMFQAWRERGMPDATSQ